MKKVQNAGLYTRDQTKYMTPFLYLALAAIGFVLCFFGAFALWAAIEGGQGSSPEILIFSIGMIAMGVFFAHTGVIHYVIGFSRSIHKHRKRQSTDDRLDSRS